jgi:hypothetical protein
VTMTDALDASDLACGELGRQMFFQHVGQYFAAAPRLAPLPLGTACSICGSVAVQLWLTGSGEASCLAQQTITRKRAARPSAAEPAIPAADPSGMTAMGDGNMIIAGPHRAMIITKLLPDKPVPSDVEIKFSDKGCIRAAKLDLLEKPPRPPFVVIICEKNARFRTRVTVDASQITINGPSGQILNRPYLSRLIEMAGKVGKKELLELMGLRQRLAGAGGTSNLKNGQCERDQAAFLDLRAAGLLTPAEFRSLPSPGSPEAAFLRQVLL